MAGLPARALPSDDVLEGGSAKEEGAEEEEEEAEVGCTSAKEAGCEAVDLVATAGSGGEVDTGDDEGGEEADEAEEPDAKEVVMCAWLSSGALHWSEEILSISGSSHGTHSSGAWIG